MSDSSLLDFLRDRDPNSVWNLTFRKALLLLTIKECFIEIREIDKKLADLTAPRISG